MQKIKADIYLEDEARRIGAGWRRVDIERGRVWIYVTERATGIRVRIPARSFDLMKVTTPRSRWTVPMQVLK